MNIKSHFILTKQQRSGIFVLILLILIVQGLYIFVDFSSEEFKIDAQELAKFEAEIDSLRYLKEKESQPEIFPFNPNYITDYKGYTLGMTSQEIDRLIAFRKQNKWVNSAQEFQKVTQVSDTLLNQIAPYFKFPDWITHPKPKRSDNYNFVKGTKPKTFDQKEDLNTASAEQLQQIYGIGEKLSERIVNYRMKSGGFIDDVQLQEVYGLSVEVIDRILENFTVKSAKPIQKLNINTATLDQLVTIKYIDYEIAHQIIEQRILREGFKSFEELTKLKDFPVKKSDIIKLYLTFD